MRPFKRVKTLDADEYRVLKRAVASRKSAAGKARREDRAALQPGPHRPREDSLPSQFYLSVDVSLPGSSHHRGKPMKGESRWES